jgi:SMODS and SLOG-associating 2TM effector domain 1
MSDMNAPDLDNEPLGREEVDILYQIYMEKRVAAQISFYESRMRENQLNADFTFTVGALVMTLSSLIATVSASGGLPFLSLISAILPAFAALLGSFRQLYGWERQTSIYRDSLLGLERVKLIAPDNDRVASSDLVSIYPELVASSETVFTGEVNQWGQFIQEKEKGAEGETTDSLAMTNLVGNLELTDDQRAIITAVLSGGTGKPSTTNLLASVSTSTTVVASSSSTGSADTADSAEAMETIEATSSSTQPNEETPPEEKTESESSGEGVEAANDSPESNEDQPAG